MMNYFNFCSYFVPPTIYNKGMEKMKTILLSPQQALIGSDIRKESDENLSKREFFFFK